MSARDQTQPVLAALGDELTQAIDAGRGVRISQQFTQEILDAIGGLLDQLDEAHVPRDERLRERNLLLQATARELLGRGDRDVFDLPDAAKSIREAAGVGRDADINTLLAAVATGRDVAARPEYGPGSRWQNLRDQVQELTGKLAQAQQIADTSSQTVTTLHGQLEQAKDAVRVATWVAEPAGWLIGDDARTQILEMGA